MCGYLKFSKKIKNHGLKHIRTGSLILSRTVIMNNNNRPDNLLGYGAVWGGYLIFVAPTSSRYLKKIRINELPVSSI